MGAALASWGIAEEKATYDGQGPSYVAFRVFLGSEFEQTNASRWHEGKDTNALGNLVVENDVALVLVASNALANLVSGPSHIRVFSDQLETILNAVPIALRLGCSEELYAVQKNGKKVAFRAFS
jgi:hypothetical protein